MNHFIVFNIIGYFLALFQVAIVLNVSSVHLSFKRLVLILIPIYGVHTLLFAVLLNEFNFGLISIVCWTLFLILFYHGITKQSLQKSAFMAVSQYFFLSAGFNYLSGFIINQFPEDTSYFLHQNLFIPRIAVALVYILLLVYIKKTTTGYSSLNHLITKYSSFYFAFFLSFAAFDIMFMPRLAGFPYVNSIAQAVATTLFLVLFIHSLWYVKKDHRLELTQRELETSLSHASSQENTLNNLRTFKHDITGIFLSLKSLIHDGDINTTQSIIDDITTTLNPTHLTTISDVVKDIPILSGILTEKISISEMNNIKFNINILEEKINLRYCTDLDYSKMIGILLDNAIQSAKNSIHRTVELSILAEKGRLHTLITNSCDSEMDINTHSNQSLNQIHLIQNKYEEISATIELYTTFENGYLNQKLVI